MCAIALFYLLLKRCKAKAPIGKAVGVSQISPNAHRVYFDDPTKMVTVTQMDIQDAVQEAIESKYLDESIWFMMGRVHGNEGRAGFQIEGELGPIPETEMPSMSDLKEPHQVFSAEVVAAVQGAVSDV